MTGAGSTRRTLHRSLWLQEALRGETDLPALQGASRADVVIAGGGYVGLWTALRIKERQPGCEVAILERDICGAGASGRNGGQAHAWWERLGHLIHLYGQEEGIRLARASQTAVEELSSLEEAEFHQTGWLWTATTPAQMGAWEDAVRLCESLGIPAFRRLDPEEVRRRTGSPVHLAGIEEPVAGTVHPGKMVRGLRRRTLQAGVRIYEHSPVVEIGRSAPSTVRTAAGSLTADRVVVATNAWAAGLPELRNRLFVVGSDIVATAPIPERLAEIGWAGEPIADSQQRVLYYRTTADGRVAMGRGGGTIAYGGGVNTAFDRSPRWAADTTQALRRVYPMLADVPIEYDWAGPIDRSYYGLPFFGRLGGRPNIFYGVGWSGTGVAESSIGGRILASLALGIDDEWSGCGLVEGRVGRYPSEPIRYLGAALVRQAVIEKGKIEDRGGRAGRLLQWAAGLTPGEEER